MRPELRAALTSVLLAFALAARAGAQEWTELDEATSLLLSPELRSDQARALEASGLLEAERERKIADLSSAVVDFGLHASVAASPLRLLRSAGKIGRGVRDWNDRTAVEDEALALLAPGARSGGLDEASLALYTRLERRESAERVEQLLADAERALGAGDLRRTRRTLDRALALEPGSSHADRLLDEIDEREWLALPDDEELAEDTALHGRVDTWELEIGTALLVDEFERAQSLGPDDSSAAELARATAAYLSGEREAALEAFHEIARGDDQAASSAAGTLADRCLNPEGAFEDELRIYRTQRALGWMGGEELAATALPSTSDALAMSRDGYRAWQKSLRAWRNALKPVNLVVDAPARAWRSWQPDGKALHAAAERYLALAPDGDRAPDAVHWLDALAAQKLRDPRVSPFRDGMLVLPRAQTSFERLSATRIVVARAALETAAPELLAKLAGDASPALVLLLVPKSARTEATGTVLSREESLDVLERLAAGLERATLAPRGTPGSSVLTRLRRLDARVREGGALVARSWTEETASGFDAFGSALLDSERARTIGAVEIERRKETLVAERQLAGSTSYCPHQTTCIDVQRAVDPVFYASSDADGDIGVGARAGFEDANFSLEVGMSGPRASLVLPFARWLGISRFFPVEARLAVGLDGISAGPGRDDRAADLPEPSL
ncbi:MAG: hypothetical protein WEF50_00785 [Myxococcota bacterium]